MAALPTPPTWATGTNYPADAGPDAGALTRIEPSAGYKAVGARRDSPVEARYNNWLWGTLCDFCVVLFNILTGVDTTTNVYLAGLWTFEATGKLKMGSLATLQMDAGSIFYHHGAGLFRISNSTIIQIDGNWPVTGNVSCTDLAASGNVGCVDLTASGIINANGGLDVAGGVFTCDVNASLNGTTTNHGVFTNAGIGRLRLARATAVNGNATYKWGGGGGTTALGDYIHYTAAPGGNIVWTLDETGSGGGDVVDIYTTDSGLAGSGFTITITSSSGGTTDAVLTGALGFRAARMVRDGGTGKWRRAVYLE